ncbi:hypothetical protein [Thiobacillus sp.]
MSEHYDEHYINSVTALGDTHEVVTTQAIFTRNGIKLIDRGASINSAMREKLVRHKLIPVIDECLSVADGVTNASLRDRAREILDNEPRFQFFWPRPARNRAFAQRLLCHAAQRAARVQTHGGARAAPGDFRAQ